MLTKKQYELLIFLSERIDKDGVAPSFDEMKDALGLKSKSGIHRLITGLEERGFIRRLPHRARALEILKVPQSLAEARTGFDHPAPFSAGDRTDASRTRTAYPDGDDGVQVIHGPFAGSAPATDAGSSDWQYGAGNDDGRPAPGSRGTGGESELPLYGRIAAGTPIEALRDTTTTVAVPVGLLGRGEHYALEVDGDSMVNAGILDGDTVIIQRTDTAENGQIVVALIDDVEVTLKRLRRKGATIALEPANPDYETRIFGPDRVRIQGRLVSLIRHYS